MIQLTDHGMMALKSYQADMQMIIDALLSELDS
jgi:hypothetical protein